MRNVFLRSLSVIFCLLFLCPCLPVLAADQNEAYDDAFYAAHDWDSLAAMVLEESHADESTAALGYINTVTGEEHYFNGDDYFTGASLYKMPLNMYYAERIRQGNASWDDLILGAPYSFVQTESLTYSNNPFSLYMVNLLGGWPTFRSLVASYMDEDPEDADFTSRNNAFTARQMARCTALLAKESERFPGVVDALLPSAPGLFLEYADVPYDIAQKYGNNSEEGQLFHVAGIVYTEDPIALVVLTRRALDQRTIMERYCELMCGYAEYQRKVRLEAEAAAAAEAERLAEEAARLEAEAEKRRQEDAADRHWEEMLSHDEKELPRTLLLPLAAAVLLILLTVCLFRREKFLLPALGLAAVLLILIAGRICLPSGEGGRDKLSSPGSLLSQHMTNAKHEALSDLTYIKKVYRIPESSTVAPAPDPAGYGEAATFEEFRPVLEAAEELLAGQELVLNAETELAPGSSIHYYRDDSILAVVWLETHGIYTCTFSEVKIADASQLRRKIAGDSYGSPIRLYPTELAKECNAVAALDGDYYVFQNTGIHVYQREVYMDDGSKVDTCFFDTKGNMLFVKAGELGSREEIEAYCRENDVLFSTSFGPVMVENGVNVTPQYYWMGQSSEVYARAALAQMDDLHYLMMTVYLGCTVEEAADIMIGKGCTHVYAMDGGQSATIVLNNQQLNPSQFNSQRPLSDIIYFASSLPD
ncbi:MAG: hypothetical protein E7442_06655 [Ruminococcaceae bacterium]|nr:hypothetical protein [Oscillospiraceae bacterium]